MIASMGRRRALGGLVGAGAAMLPLAAFSETGKTGQYPTKPIALLLPMPPGGSSDALMRLMGPRLGERLGQPVIIENKPGAGGGLALAAVARAPADGYTIGVGAAGGLSANVSLYRRLPYSPARDFAPISLLAYIPFVLVANPAASANSVSQLMQQARSAPGAISVAHAGDGTAMHLSIQLLSQLGGAKFLEIAYRGNGPAASDVLAGHVPYAMLDIPAALQMIRAGKLRPLLVTSSRRLQELPEVPTADEAGIAGYESTGWFGLVAPAATPPAVLERVGSAVREVIGDKEIQARARGLGIELASSTPAEFQYFIAVETEKWARVIKSSGTRLE